MHSLKVYEFDPLNFKNIRQGDITIGVVLGIKIKQNFLRASSASTTSEAMWLQKELEAAHAKHPKSL